METFCDCHSTLPLSWSRCNRSCPVPRPVGENRMGAESEDKADSLTMPFGHRRVPAQLAQTFRGS